MSCARNVRPAPTRGLHLETLEDRRLLAVGPYLHTHNRDQLAVVDAARGEIQILARLSGFVENDSRMNDIAFGPDARLFGIDAKWLYDIHPVTGRLTRLGEHQIPSANALAVDKRGSIYVMGPNSPQVHAFTVDRDKITSGPRVLTLSGTSGAKGDIAFLNLRNDRCQGPVLLLRNGIGLLYGGPGARRSKQLAADRARIAAPKSGRTVQLHGRHTSKRIVPPLWPAAA